MTVDHLITAVVPISPIPSHPDTTVVDEAVASIRRWLPNAEILLQIDGVRAEQEDRAADYREATRRILWNADHNWGNSNPWLFDSHRHQIGMMRATIDDIRTPLLLYVEQDAPIVTDEHIDWATITDYILDGQSHCVRLYHERNLVEEHSHMHHGRDGDFVLTSQWSQRPHIASVAYYRRLLEHFSEGANCFLEDVLHGVVWNAYRRDKLLGWDNYRTHIWAPEDLDNIKRSYHLDGRAGADKYDRKQRF